MPGDALSDVPAGQPINNESAIGNRQRSVREERRSWIAAEPLASLSDRDHGPKRLEINRSKKQTGRTHPVLTQMSQYFDFFVVAVDVPYTHWSTADRIQHLSLEPFEIVGVELTKCRGCEVDEIVLSELHADV